MRPLATRPLEARVASRRSASGAEDFDGEDQAVALLDSRLGLTVGVAIRRGHRDADGGTDLLSSDRLLEARHDSVKRELGWGAAFVGAVEHFAVTSVDAHVADGDGGSRRNDRAVSGVQRVYRGLSDAERLRHG